MENKKSILNAAVAVSLLIIAGKILGFGREAMVAAYYGATAETDAFFLANNMHNMLFPAVSGSLSTAFTSLYVKRLTENGEKEGDLLGSRMVIFSTMVGIVLGMLGAVVAPLIVPIFAPGFSGTQLTLAVHLTRITMSVFVLTVLQFVFSAILNSKNLFIGSQVAALFFNISIMALMFAFGKNQSMDVLTLSVVAGMIMQLLVLIICCRGHFHFTPLAKPLNKDIGQVIHLAVPILLGNSVWQLNNIVDRALSSMLGEGALSALSYANSLNSLVINIFASSLTTVLYPTLTSEAAGGHTKHYAKTLIQSMNGLTFILTPICSVTLMSAVDIVSVVYGRGSFAQAAIDTTSIVLLCYAPRFLFVGISEVLTKGFFAIQDTKTPARNSAIGVGCNIVFSIVFVRWLGIRGIALGTTLSAGISALLLIINIRKAMPFIKISDFLKPFTKQITAGIAACAALYVSKSFLLVESSFIRFAIQTVIGFVSYAVVLLVIDKKQIQGVFLMAASILLKRKNR